MMKLYFINDSKQKKYITETDYAEDVYDEIILFLQEHKINPHFMTVAADGQDCKISWDSQSSFFLCENMDEDGRKELEEML